MAPTKKSTDTLLDWLRDAHAAEEQAVTMLNGTASRLANYPELRRRIEQHAEESRRQAAAVRGRIESLGSSTSTLKDTGAKILGFGQATAGLFVSDEVMKALLASTAFEEMEIAAYTALIEAADHCGDQETKRVCTSILEEEVSMRDFLQTQIPTVTRQFLTRDESGMTARR